MSLVDRRVPPSIPIRVISSESRIIRHPAAREISSHRGRIRTMKGGISLVGIHGPRRIIGLPSGITGIESPIRILMVFAKERRLRVRHWHSVNIYGSHIPKWSWADGVVASGVVASGIS